MSSSNENYRPSFASPPSRNQVIRLMGQEQQRGLADAEQAQLSAPPLFVSTGGQEQQEDNDNNQRPPPIPQVIFQTKDISDDPILRRKPVVFSMLVMLAVIVIMSISISVVVQTRADAETNNTEEEEEDHEAIGSTTTISQWQQNKFQSVAQEYATQVQDQAQLVYHSMHSLSVVISSVVHLATSATTTTMEDDEETEMTIVTSNGTTTNTTENDPSPSLPALAARSHDPTTSSSSSSSSWPFVTVPNLETMAEQVVLERSYDMGISHLTLLPLVSFQQKQDWETYSVTMADQWLHEDVIDDNDENNNHTVCPNIYTWVSKNGGREEEEDATAFTTIESSNEDYIFLDEAIPPNYDIQSLAFVRDVINDYYAPVWQIVTSSSSTTSFSDYGGADQINQNMLRHETYRNACQEFWKDNNGGGNGRRQAALFHAPTNPHEEYGIYDPRGSYVYDPSMAPPMAILMVPIHNQGSSTNGEDLKGLLTAKLPWHGWFATQLTSGPSSSSFSVASSSATTADLHGLVLVLEGSSGCSSSSTTIGKATNNKSSSSSSSSSSSLFWTYQLLRDSSYYNDEEEMSIEYLGPLDRHDPDYNDMVVTWNHWLSWEDGEDGNEVGGTFSSTVFDDPQTCVITLHVYPSKEFLAEGADDASRWEDQQQDELEDDDDDDDGIPLATFVYCVMVAFLACFMMSFLCWLVYGRMGPDQKQDSLRLDSSKRRKTSTPQDEEEWDEYFAARRNGTNNPNNDNGGDNEEDRQSPQNSMPVVPAQEQHQQTLRQRFGSEASLESSHTNKKHTTTPSIRGVGGSAVSLAGLSNVGGDASSYTAGGGNALGPPIAELFPNCTVMYANIVGFTAWSSAREPSQVFSLLESIYNAFDKLALSSEVFRVDTVGDCYCAAAGLPIARKDHAIIMATFARNCRSTMRDVVHKLEVVMGPDTSDLSLRIGLHSGPVTAGVLRVGGGGENKSRFQLFGQTVSTAARIERTGIQHGIHISQETADLLRQGGNEDWVQLRDRQVEAGKGQGKIQTFWLVSSASADGGSFSEDVGLRMDGDDTQPGVNSNPTVEEQHFQKRESVEAMVNARDENKFQRLIGWNADVLLRQLRPIVAMRPPSQIHSSIAFICDRDLDASSSSMSLASWKSSDQFDGDLDEKLKEIKALRIRPAPGATVLDEVKEIITLPSEPKKYKIDPTTIEFAPIVEEQLRDYVTAIASLYRTNSFHSFEHASHVTMSVCKLLSRVVTPDMIDYDTADESKEQEEAMLHNYTYGITSDPITQFACAFSALIHDVDHTGVPNTTLISENADIAALYNNKSVAEQNSVDLAWELLMEPAYAELRSCIYTSDEELERFRQLVVNSVMATDIMDKELGQLRKKRWEKAFAESAEKSGELSTEDVNRKATIVIEHLIQASDVSHTMQHWHIYIKWNERLFQEMYRAFKEGRSDKDPSEGWYKGELGFFDFYLIPLAKKLKQCQVFGVASDEYLNYAQANRREWEMKGEEIVAQYVKQYQDEFGNNK